MPTLLANTKKQTWYFDANDAVKIGLADRVGVVLNPASGASRPTCCPRKPTASTCAWPRPPFASSARKWA